MRPLESFFIAAGVLEITSGSPPTTAITQKGPFVVEVTVMDAAEGELAFDFDASFGDDTVLVGTGVSGNSTAVIRPGAKAGGTIFFSLHGVGSDTAYDFSEADVTLDFLIMGLV